MKEHARIGQIAERYANVGEDGSDGEDRHCGENRHKITGITKVNVPVKSAARGRKAWPKPQGK
ncbi:hypothetical protein ABRP92_11085 [Pectobacterium aroidearum]|uniref:hypothetical protein n=1 Tax=Pectobacterium aroidearum TaxID=1201031 RepID=UPI0032EC6B08